MTKAEFLTEFRKLESPFAYLQRDPESRRAREAAYWSVVKDFLAQDWKAAIIAILGNWPDEHFPLPYAVKSYVDQQTKQRFVRKAKHDCEACGGTGWMPIQKNRVRYVQECECRARAGRRNGCFTSPLESEQNEEINDDR